MDPDEVRRRGARKALIGVAILLAVIVLTFFVLPQYSR